MTFTFTLETIWKKATAKELKAKSLQFFGKQRKTGKTKQPGQTASESRIESETPAHETWDPTAT